jgi:hypothetical protein
VIEEIACDEHGIDALVTGARDRARNRLLVATRTGAKMTVGRAALSPARGSGDSATFPRSPQF